MTENTDDRVVLGVVVVKDDRCFTISAIKSGSTNKTELDSHADTCVGGANSILLEDSGETATVHSFSGERKPFASIPIGTIATSWTDEGTSETFVLQFPESLYFGDRLPHSLLCPNQLWAHGIRVEDTPRQFDGSSSHLIVVEGLKIPLYLDGVIFFFESRKPNEDELENCRRITLTSDSRCDPNAASFATQEQIVSDQMDPIVHEVRMTDRVVPSPELMSVQELEERLISCVYVSSDDELHEGLDSTEGRRIKAIATKEKKTVITKETLARRWGIGLKIAERTL
jgi:hypothetical protein